MQKVWKVLALAFFAMGLCQLVKSDYTNEHLGSSSIDWRDDDIGPLLNYRLAVREEARDLLVNWGDYKGSHRHSEYLEGHEPMVVIRKFMGEYKVTNAPWWDATHLVYTPIYREPGYLRYAKRYLRSTAWALLGFSFLLLARRAFTKELRSYLFFRLLGHSLSWPVSVFVFPGKELIYGVQQTLCWAHYTLSCMLSLIPMCALKAQNKDSSRNRNLPQIQVNIYADGHERQTWLFANWKHWSLYQQQRWSTDGASPFSYLGFGPRFNIGRIANTVWAGPQLTHQTGKADKVLLYAATQAAGRNWSLLFANKLALPADGHSPLADRHVQNIHGPPMPNWLSFQAEELRISGSNQTWRELEVGPMVKLGKVPSLPSWLKDFYLYPFHDFARGKWSLRVGYSHTF